MATDQGKGTAAAVRAGQPGAGCGDCSLNHSFVGGGYGEGDEAGARARLIFGFGGELGQKGSGVKAPERQRLVDRRGALRQKEC